MLKVNDIQFQFQDLLKAGKFVADKSGVKTLEIVNASFIADEESIFGVLNYDYIDRELEWYKSMSLNVNDIPGKVPEIWKRVATPDGRINSNYGWCIWAKENSEQYKNVLSELICNTETRRAIMIYTRPSMHDDFCKDGMSDFMCTNTVQYLLRDGQIHAIVNMRSNDVWAGYRNDYAWQKHVLDLLVADYNRLTESNIAAGDIHWNVGSLHCYERNFWMVECYGKFRRNMSKAEYIALCPDSKYIS
jgi:thymidylate synthase